ncbi:MAG: helicase HerA domain-containing protein [Rhizomicrobium sp.]
MSFPPSAQYALMPNDVSYFARTNFHLENRRFGIKQSDRLSHMYVLGKTGVGKSTLLKTLALQDFEAGRGFALVDPHGDVVEPLAKGIATLDPGRLVYLDATNPWLAYGYNPLRRVRDDKIPLAVSGLLETLKKLWPDALGRANGARPQKYAVRTPRAQRCQAARYPAPLFGR